MSRKYALICSFGLLAACNPLKLFGDKAVDAGPAVVALPPATVEPAAEAVEALADSGARNAGDPNWIPSNGDDQAQAKRVVNRGNYKAELDSLAKEIESAPTAPVASPTHR